MPLKYYKYLALI